MTGDLFGEPEALAAPWKRVVDSGQEAEDGCRFLIWRIWDRARPLAAWLMCNPSEAGEEENDPTVRRVCHFSAGLGMGGFIGANVWPLRTPYPSELWPRIKAGELDVAGRQRRNLQAIRRAVDRAHLGLVAFGAEAPRRYPLHVAEALEAFDRPHFNRLCLGVNPEGWPLHPLARGKFAIPNDRRPSLWSPPAG